MTTGHCGVVCMFKPEHSIANSVKRVYIAYPARPISSLSVIGGRGAGKVRAGPADVVNIHDLLMYQWINTYFTRNMLIQ